MESTISSLKDLGWSYDGEIEALWHAFIHPDGRRALISRIVLDDSDESVNPTAWSDLLAQLNTIPPDGRPHRISGLRVR